MLRTVCSGTSAVDVAAAAVLGCLLHVCVSPCDKPWQGISCRLGRGEQQLQRRAR